jgi:hypothetical protein
MLLDSHIPTPTCHSRLGNSALRAILDGRVHPKSFWIAPSVYEALENAIVNGVSPSCIDPTSNLHFVLLCKVIPEVLLLWLKLAAVITPFQVLGDPASLESKEELFGFIGDLKEIVGGGDLVLTDDVGQVLAGQGQTLLVPNR